MKNLLNSVLFISAIVFTTPSCAVAKKTLKTNINKSFVKVYKKFTFELCHVEGDISICTTKGYHSTGSGISVDMNNNFDFILTAGHVCDPEIPNLKILPDNTSIKNIKVSYYVKNYKDENMDGEIIVYTLESVEKDTGDLCLLYVPELGIPKIKLSKQSPKIGDRLISMAAPMGIYHPPAVPIFEGIFSGDINKVTSLVTIPAAGGSSGAAILNVNLKIVGVIFAVSSVHNEITLSTNFQITSKFLNDIKKKINNPQSN